VRDHSIDPKRRKKVWLGFEQKEKRRVTCVGKLRGK